MEKYVHTNDGVHLIIIRLKMFIFTIDEYTFLYWYILCKRRKIASIEIICITKKA